MEAGMKPKVYGGGDCAKAPLLAKNSITGMISLHAILGFHLHSLVFVCISNCNDSSLLY